MIRINLIKTLQCLKGETGMILTSNTKSDF
uniref:Uncharacterized protein n=1 Tax=Anguilla anguilla TaxID=7936 RepID=A0A0E9TIM2_ANGAN